MYQEYINHALKAASYHENQAFLFAHPESDKYGETVAHLRAYYWELWSVWDYILQSVNSQTSLIKKPHEVDLKFLTKLKKEMPEYPHHKDLEDAFNEPLATRIRTLRNYAHKWQIDPYMLDIDDDDKVNVISLLINPQEDKLMSQTNVDRNDLWFMSELVKKFVAKGII